MAEKTEVIWRYMDVAKYVALLARGLFFAQPSTLGDPWEGTWGVLDVRKFREAIDVQYCDYGNTELGDDPLVLLSHKRLSFSHENEVRFLASLRADECEAIALPAEFLKWPKGQQKARRYAAIGGSQTVFLGENNVADSRLGSHSHESRRMEIHRLIFGKAPKPTDKKRVASARDALHIDQANQHGSDFFVIADKVLLQAAAGVLTEAGIRTRVCTPEDALGDIIAYFTKLKGTFDPAALAHDLREEGPIILGSNSCGRVTLADNESGEELLAFHPTETGAAALRCIIRGKDGRRLMTVAPGQKLAFDGPGARISAEIGPAPLLIGEETCRSFAIRANGYPALAGRILRSGRMLLYDACLYNKGGRLAVRINRDALELVNVSLLFH